MQLFSPRLSAYGVLWINRYKTWSGFIHSAHCIYKTPWSQFHYFLSSDCKTEPTCRHVIIEKFNENRWKLLDQMLSYCAGLNCPDNWPAVQVSATSKFARFKQNNSIFAYPLLVKHKANSSRLRFDHWWPYLWVSSGFVRPVDICEPFESLISSVWFLT